MSPLPPIDCVAIRHPGQVRRRRTRAGIQKEFDYIELSLDSGSRPAKRRSSGMTGSVDCDIVSRGEEIFAELNDLITNNWRRDEMAECGSCGDSIEKGEEFEHLARTLCEDCYLGALNPPKACDPWAVHTAKSSMSQGQQLTPPQERILMLLKDRGPLTAQEVMSELKISESEFKNNFATLRHMELARGFKEGDKVYYCLFSFT